MCCGVRASCFIWVISIEEWTLFGDLVSLIPLSEKLCGGLSMVKRTHRNAHLFPHRFFSINPDVGSERCVLKFHTCFCIFLCPAIFINVAPGIFHKLALAISLKNIMWYIWHNRFCCCQMYHIVFCVCVCVWDWLADPSQCYSGTAESSAFTMLQENSNDALKLNVSSIFRPLILKFCVKNVVIANNRAKFSTVPYSSL